MARIARTSLLYRSKKRICSDLAAVLSSSTLHLGTKQAVVDQALWVWSEFDGKYAGCPRWSECARKSGLNGKGLIHEHVVPRKVVRAKLYAIRKPTAGSVYRVMQYWCIGAVILKSEDERLNDKGLNSKMPDDWDGHDRLARYKKVGISLVA
jgi:hypothetical protein